MEKRCRLCGRKITTNKPYGEKCLKFLRTTALSGQRTLDLKPKLLKRAVYFIKKLLYIIRS